MWLEAAEAAPWWRACAGPEGSTAGEATSDEHMAPGGRTTRLVSDPLDDPQGTWGRDEVRPGVR